MKRILLAAFAVLFWAAAFGADAAQKESEGKVAWYKGTLDKALEASKAKAGLVMIDFYTDWCGWCKRLDKDTWSDASVAEALKDVVAIKLNAEDKGEGQKAAQKYGVESFPTITFLRSDGTVANQEAGYLNPEGFKERLAQVKSQAAGQGEAETILKKNPDDPKGNFLMGKTLVETDPEKAYECFEKVIRLDPKNTSKLLGDARFYALEIQTMVIVDRMRNIMEQVFRGAQAQPVSAKIALPPKATAAMDEMLKAGKKYPASRPAKAQEEMDKEMTAHIGKVFGLVADEFEVFTKENPSSAFVGDALLRAANFYVSADKFGKAIPLLEKLESSHAQDARFLNQYAWALLKQNKDLKKAHALAEKADKLAPKNVPIMDTLAEIEFAMGNADRALEICNEEIKLAPGAPMLQKRLEKYTEAKNKKKK